MKNKTLFFKQILKNNIMETKFELLGDELRHLSQNKAKIRDQIINSFYDTIKNTIVEHLRNNIDDFPGKQIDIKMPELFRTGFTEGVIVPPKYNFYATLSKSFDQVMINYVPQQRFPTENEMDWCGEKLQKYFISQGMNAIYYNTTLKICW